MKRDVSVFEVPYIWLRREVVGAPRNNLIFNDVRIFRVGDPVTLKMLNSFIVSLLRGAHTPPCIKLAYYQNITF